MCFIFLYNFSSKYLSLDKHLAYCIQDAHRNTHKSWSKVTIKLVHSKWKFIGPTDFVKFSTISWICQVVFRVYVYGWMDRLSKLNEYSAVLGTCKQGTQISHNLVGLCMDKWEYTVCSKILMFSCLLVKFDPKTLLGIHWFESSCITWDSCLTLIWQNIQVFGKQGNFSVAVERLLWYIKMEADVWY